MLYCSGVANPLNSKCVKGDNNLMLTRSWVSSPFTAYQNREKDGTPSPLFAHREKDGTPSPIVWMKLIPAQSHSFLHSDEQPELNLENDYPNKTVHNLKTNSSISIL